MEQKLLKILFFGDITGRQGRNAVKSFLQSLKTENSDETTFVIANIENASHGFGLTKKNYIDLEKAELIALHQEIIFGTKKIFMNTLMMPTILLDQ